MSLPATGTSAPVLLLHPDDDVVITTRHLNAGQTVLVGGAEVVLAADVPTGFKLAAHDLTEGTVVHRLGVPIGRTTAVVARGDVVHVHNLESQYLRTHRRGEA